MCSATSTISSLELIGALYYPMLLGLALVVSILIARGPEKK